MPGIPAATAAFAAAVSFAATGDAALVWAVPPESASAAIGSSVRMRRDVFMLSTVSGLNPIEKAANSTSTVRLTAPSCEGLTAKCACTQYGAGVAGKPSGRGQRVDAASAFFDRLVITDEGFAASWPNFEGEFADHFNSMPKYVVWSTLKDPEWTNTPVLTGISSRRCGISSSGTSETSSFTAARTLRRR